MSLPSHCISYFDIVILELVIHITENIQLKRGVMTRTWQSSWSVMRWIACMYLSSPQWKKKNLYRKSLCFIYDAIWGGFGAKEGPAIESCPVRLKVRIIWTAATPQPWQLSKYTHTHTAVPFEPRVCSSFTKNHFWCSGIGADYLLFSVLHYSIPFYTVNVLTAYPQTNCEDCLLVWIVPFVEMGGCEV